MQDLLLGRYALGEALGDGGFGTVYRATDARTNKPAAVKLVAPLESMEPEDARTLIEREVKALMVLNHPGVIRLLDWGILADGRCAIVTELLEGCDLEHAIARIGPLPSIAGIALAHEMLSALAAAHAQAIHHRDVKPANVFLCTSGRVVLLDFGIARASEHSASKTLAKSANTGLIGTPYFFAPERVAGLPTGAFSDVFAAAGTLYYALSGALPFAPNAAALLDVFKAIASNTRRPLHQVRPDVMPELAAFVERGLGYKPQDRPADAGVACAELAPLLARSPEAHAALKSYAERAANAGKTEMATLAARTRSLAAGAKASETAIVASPSGVPASQTAIVTLPSGVPASQTAIVTLPSGALPSSTAIVTRQGAMPPSDAPAPRRTAVLAVALVASIAVIAIVAWRLSLGDALPAPPRPLASTPLPPTPPTPPSPPAIPAPAPIETPSVPPSVPDAPKAPVVMKTAVIKVVMQQWADVEIDGSSQGRKQHAARFTVTEGPHQIVFSHPGYPVRSARVRVAGGEEKVVHLDFEKQIP